MSEKVIQWLGAGANLLVLLAVIYVGFELRWDVNALQKDVSALHVGMSAVRKDISEVKNELSADIEAVKNELSADIEAVKNELSADIVAVKNELSADIVALDARLSQDIRALDARLSADIVALDTRLSADIATVDARLSGEMVALRSEIADVRSDVSDVRLEIADVRSDVSDVRLEMSTMHRRLDRVLDGVSDGEQLAQSSSPLSLSEIGEEVASEVDAHALVAKHLERLAELVADADHPYELQMRLAARLDWGREVLSLREYRRVRAVAHSRGMPIGRVYFVLGIVARDALMPRFGWGTPCAVDPLQSWCPPLPK